MLDLRGKVPVSMIGDLDVNLNIVEIDTLPSDLSDEFHNQNSGSQSKYEICLVERFQEMVFLYQYKFKKIRNEWHIHGKNMLMIMLNMKEKSPTLSRAEMR